jgi:putative nucleotidyltransferase with HDIG domain
MKKRTIEISRTANDESLRRQGIVRRSLHATGGDPVPRRGDWLEELLLSSAPAREAMQEIRAACACGDVPAPRELVPGLWIVATSASIDRRSRGASIALIPTKELCDGEYLDVLCQAGRLDRALVGSMLEGLDLVEKVDLPRTMDFLRMLAATEGEVDRRKDMLGDMGRELGESYEEIHLFHTLIGETSVATSPRAFLAKVVDELLRILPFTWIGVRIRTDILALPERFSGFLLGGDHEDRADVLRVLGDRLVATLEGRDPVVLDPDKDARFTEAIGCGSSAIACLVAGDGGPIGVIFAGNKQGPDETASSIETKLLGAAAEHVSVFLRNASMYEHLDAMFLGTVQAMVSAIDAKDQYTRGHSQRVSWLASELASACGLSDTEVRRVRLAGLVHDVGKIGVPEAVLAKAGRLDEAEFSWIKRHPEIGARILRDIPQMDEIIPAVLHHHERWDGKGYPAGLSKGEIPHIARFVALADAFDAMSSDRTYRAARGRKLVMNEIRGCSGSQFDPDLVGPFLALNLDGYDRMVREHRGLSENRRDAA